MPARLPKPADQLRCKLYDAELAIRKAIPNKAAVAANPSSEPKFSRAPLAAAMIEEKQRSE